MPERRAVVSRPSKPHSVLAKRSEEQQSSLVTALEVLQELEADGLRVTWPCGRPCGSCKGPEPRDLLAERGTVPSTLPQGTGCQQLPSSELREALAELEELEKSGLRVARPA